MTRLKARGLFQQSIPFVKGSYELTLLAIAYEGDPDQFHMLAKLCSVESFAHRAQELGQTVEAILAFAAGRRTEKATALALQLLDGTNFQSRNDFSRNCYIFT